MAIVIMSGLGVGTVLTLGFVPVMYSLFFDWRRAKTKTALIQIKDLEQSLEMYKLDVGRFPSTGEGLQALVTKPSNAAGWNGPYLKSDVPLDPWKREYQYKYPGERGELDIFTYGQNGTPGGEGEDSDVGNWQ